MRSAKKRTAKRTASDGLFCAVVALCILGGCREQKRTTLTLSAAASLKDAIVEIEAAYKEDHGIVDFRDNFGSSGTLAREIENGAPVDAFLSAASGPMDDLETKGI